MKKTKRQAFNFLRSYFDVLNKIPSNDDKLNFLLSVINKQFLDEDPTELNLIVELSYESQRHAIEKSVKGYKDKKKTDLLGNPTVSSTKDPKQDPYEGGSKAPYLQEEEEEKEKGKEEEEEKSIYKSIQTIANDYKKNERVINAVLKNGQQLAFSKEDLISKLDDFILHLESIDDTVKQDKDFKSHFLNWLRIQKKKSSEKKEKPTPAEKVFGEYYEEANTIAKQLNNLTILKNEEDKRITG